MKSYIIITKVNSLEEVDKLLKKMRKGKAVEIKEVEDNVLVTATFQRTT